MPRMVTVGNTFPWARQSLCSRLEIADHASAISNMAPRPDTEFDCSSSRIALSIAAGLGVHVALCRAEILMPGRSGMARAGARAGCGSSA